MSCYDVLNVSQSATQEEIHTSYIALSKQLHPDQQRKATPEEKLVAEAKMAEVNNAKEILGNEVRKKRYDDVQDMKRRMFVPRENAFIVLAGVVLLVYVAIFCYQLQKHSLRRTALLQDNAVKFKIRQKAHAAGKTTRDENKIVVIGDGDTQTTDMELAQIVKELGKKVPGGWTGQAPQFTDLLLATPNQPIRLTKYLWWSAKWVVKYDIQKHPYSADDEMYLTYSKLGLSRDEWTSLSQTEQDRLQRAETKRREQARKKPKRGKAKRK